MSDVTIVMGLGVTGLSCVQYLRAQDRSVVVMDTRENPPNLDTFKQQYPEVTVYTKDFPPEILASAQQIIVSPGVPLTEPRLVFAREKGVEIIGDIELFARQNTVPVIAITGSNGKTTVTTLVGEMARAAGRRVAVVGNIGEPVLNVLSDTLPPELVVMELSSFQLETTFSLNTIAATVLNISADHMDRYSSLQSYAMAKHRIYTHTQNAIINLEDCFSSSENIPLEAKRSYFGLTNPNSFNGAKNISVHNERGEPIWGLREYEGERWLAFGENNLMRVSEMKLMGEHNIANALSALALAHTVGLDLNACLSVLKTFEGLPHRCQWIAKKHDITYINDSKGTNIGACLAAIIGLSSATKGKIVLLLGGDGKGADFTELTPILRQYCRAVVLMGKDADIIRSALGETIHSVKANTMQEAVVTATHLASPGDLVLLSPACASTDQYRHFMHRGEVFVEAVHALKE